MALVNENEKQFDPVGVSVRLCTRRIHVCWTLFLILYFRNEKQLARLCTQR